MIVAPKNHNSGSITCFSIEGGFCLDMEGEGNEVKHPRLREEVAPGVNKKRNLFDLSGMDLGNFENVW